MNSFNKYSKESEKSFLLIICAIFIVLTFFVILDIFTLIIYSLLFAYFLLPVYNFYLNKIGDKRISALLALTSATIVIIIPIAILSYFLILNLIKIILQYKIYIENPEIFNLVIADFLEKFTNSTVLSNVNFSELFNSFVLFVLELSKNFFASMPIYILYFFIMLFISYYILVYNKSILRGMNEYIPLSLRKQNEIIKNVTKNIKVLFKGYFLTGVIQTVVAFLGYVVLGAPNILIITFLTLFVSLIPYLGTPLVWVPVSLYMVLVGNQVGGVLLFLYGAFVISLVDNFVRPILMSDKDTIAPPLVFIGFVGGMLAFGISGIILGPLIISITVILLKFLREYYEIKTD